MTTTDDPLPVERATYRNEPMALAAHPDAELHVQIRHADAETFAEATAWNEQIEGMAGLAVRNDDPFVRQTTGLVADRLDGVTTSSDGRNTGETDLSSDGE